eukprot:GHVP01054148.1.p1 GENE.GHVP01054148.1~~GHVP01054148.1.p1  ORF type:complete len:128 (+),score=17.56 GHVP01054148.1:251-634(+)
MEPGFARGDILFLHQDRPHHDFRVGDIVVFSVMEGTTPIVHRIIETHESLEEGWGNHTMLTKGDNNNVSDRTLYLKDQLFLEEKHILGVAFAYIPYGGYITILINDYPWLKKLLILSLCYSVVVGKE